MRKLKIGIIGDLVPNYLPHVSTNDSIQHAANALSINADYIWIPTDIIELDNNNANLHQFDALWCAPGSPYKSMAGALKAIKFARENDKPYIGTCGGFQHTLLEYARNVLNIQNAEHEETSPNAENLLISKLSCSLVGIVGTIKLLPDTIAFDAYQKQSTISEQFRCNFGLNPKYYDLFINNNVKISGIGPEGEPRIIELANNRFYIATSFLPQMSSTLDKPHPLIIRYLQASLTS